MSRDFHQHHAIIIKAASVSSPPYTTDSLCSLRRLCGFSSFLRNLTNLLLTFGTDALVIMRSRNGCAWLPLPVANGCFGERIVNATAQHGSRDA
jgi:hypothetical protein